MKKIKVLTLLLLSAFILSSFCSCLFDDKDSHNSGRNRDDDVEEEDEEETKETSETSETLETTEDAGVDVASLDLLMSEVLGSDPDAAKTSIEDLFDITLEDPDTSEIYDGSGYFDEYHADVIIEGYEFNNISIQYINNGNMVTVVSFYTDYVDSCDPVFDIYSDLKKTCDSLFGPTVFAGEQSEESYLRHCAYQDSYGNEIYIMGGSWAPDGGGHYDLLSFDIPLDVLDAYDTGSDGYTTYDVSGFYDVEPLMAGLLNANLDYASQTLIDELGAGVYGEPVCYENEYDPERALYVYEGYFTVGDLYFNQLSFECMRDDNTVMAISFVNGACDASSALEAYRSLEDFCDSAYGVPSWEQEDRTLLDNSSYDGDNGEQIYIMGGSWDDNTAFGQLTFMVSLPE